MRVLLGIATGETPLVPCGAERLLERLRFSQATVRVASVVPEGAMTSLVGDVFGEVWKNVERDYCRDAQQHVSAAAERLGSAYSTDTQVLLGHPAIRLLAAARDDDSDLIAVNGSHKQPPVLGALVGSLARALAIEAPQSILIARGDVPLSRGIHAVLATDHSDYSRRSIERFAAFAPAGIERLTVLTALPPALPLEDADAWMQRESDASWRCEEVIERLRVVPAFARTQFASRVVVGAIREALDDVMVSEAAELLVLGAKGHGLWERVTLGSLSLAQAVTYHPWSVLILRVPDSL